MRVPSRSGQRVPAIPDCSSYRTFPSEGIHEPDLPTRLSLKQFEAPPLHVLVEDQMLEERMVGEFVEVVAATF